MAPTQVYSHLQHVLSDISLSVVMSWSSPSAADQWHQRLVRHYAKLYGFGVVRVVTGTLRDIPDMLIWGGVGTRMDADIESQLRRWRPVLLRET